VEGDLVTRTNAFRKALRELENRIKIFVSLPIASLSRLALRQRLEDIGRSRSLDSPGGEVGRG
jgi:arsenate reductase